MFNGCKETLCTRCAHLQVCNKSEQFLRVVKALENVSISIGGEGLIGLRDIPWVRLGELKCDYYMPGRSER